MTSHMTDIGTTSAAHALIERIQGEYLRTDAGGMSRHVERELCNPVTENGEYADYFSGSHYIDVRIDDYLEGIPVGFSVTVAESCHGGSEAILICQTNLDEPEYAYWEFRDYLKKLAEGDYIGSFRMHEGRIGDDESRVSLRYEYKFPVPGDGNVSGSMIESLVSRFLNDVFQAAVAYFELFFYPLAACSHADKHGVLEAQHPGCGSSSKVIPFPLNRRNRAR